MKICGKLLLILLLGIIICGVTEAGKKPDRAYITAAKIEIVSGDMDRYPNAIALLDTLFMYYGPYAEGLYWVSQIMVDYVDKTSGLKQKKEYVGRMVAYIDSLHMCCENKELKKKNRKNCKKYIEKADSTLQMYWRRFYNDGVEQVDEITQVAKDMSEETDSVALGYFENQLESLIDSCLDNMTMAIMIDSTDPRPYAGLATGHEKKGEYAISNEWLIRALEKSTDRNPLLIQIAYNYIRLDTYCDAIPYFREYVDNFQLTPENQDTLVLHMNNMSICYNNCEMYDSASVVFYHILEMEPDNTKALASIGRFHNQMARFASDSANQYQSAGDKAGAEKWREEQNRAFDSSQVYFRRAFELEPDNTRVVKEYAIACYIRSNFADAVTAFTRLTELRPDDVEGWTSLGDCYISMQKFEDAAQAYEKVVELEPNNREVLEHLKDLYFELKQPDKRQEIEKRLQSLK